MKDKKTALGLLKDRLDRDASSTQHPMGYGLLRDILRETLVILLDPTLDDPQQPMAPEKAVPSSTSMVVWAQYHSRKLRLLLETLANTPSWPYDNDSTRALLEEQASFRSVEEGGSTRRLNQIQMSCRVPGLHGARVKQLMARWDDVGEWDIILS